jgi:hypothetical protein
MDNDLKQYLEERFGAIDRRFEAIDQRFDAVDRRFEVMDRRFDAQVNLVENRFDTISGRFGTMEARFKHMLDGRLDALEQRLKDHVAEATHNTETRILAAFHGWARGMELRVSGMIAAVTGFEERLGLIEQRVRELESKLAA